MRKLIPLCLALIYLVGCGGNEQSTTDTSQAITPGHTVTYKAPDPMSVPEPKTPSSDSDWEAKVHNKEIEVIQVLNILNPVAAYLIAGFEQYGEQIKDQTVHEEWHDTQAQLTQATKLYEDCKKRKGAGQFNKKLFLDLENTWQLLVKTGVAGVRAKSMLDAQLQKI